MPNWTEQNLHIVGPRSEIDRFIRTGFVRRRRGEIDDLLHFTRLCPLRPRDRKDTYTHETGVVLGHFRTRTQALFSMITSWDYPAEFYARLAQHWPRLAFACTVNGEMGDFGGILLVVEGRVQNLVRDYDADYSRRAHTSAIRRLLREWKGVVADGRDYRLMSADAWRHRSMPFDAHFDDDFWFYFRSREDLVAFRRKYGGEYASRLSEGTWRRIRIPRV